MNPANAILPEDDALAAEYALGTLPHGERMVFEQRIADDRTLRDRVAWWQEQLVPMSDAVAEIAPPARLKHSLDERLFPTKDAAPRLLERLGFWKGLTGVSVALALAMAVILIERGPSPQPETFFVAEIAGDASDLRVAALFNPSEGFLRLSRAAGEAPNGRDFELWIIAGNNPPVSLGTFPDDPNFALELTDDLRQALEGGAVLAVSDEPDGGSPTGQPTGAVLGLGAVTKI